MLSLHSMCTNRTFFYHVGLLRWLIWLCVSLEYLSMMMKKQRFTAMEAMKKILEERDSDLELEL